MCLLVLAAALGGAPGVAGTADPNAPGTRPMQRFEQTGMEMGGVPIKIVLYAADQRAAEQAALAALARIRQLNAIMSDYDPASELRQLCSTSGPGKPVVVSDELWEVLVRAQDFARQSQGAFDVTVGPLVRLWRRARRQRELPLPERIAEARPLVGYELLRLDPQRQAVELLREGMRLDLGGIAKGYAADEALKVLRREGISRALVDAGGDVAVGDPPPDRAGWLIGVAALEPGGKPSRFLLLQRAAIATSGDMWQYVEIGGRRYSHLVDPRTGEALTDHSGVTVVAPDCLTADALASAVSVLGPQKGLQLIEQIPNTAALILRAPSGKLEVYQSRRWTSLRHVDPAVLQKQAPEAGP